MQTSCKCSCALDVRYWFNPTALLERSFFRRESQVAAHNRHLIGKWIFSAHCTVTSEKKVVDRNIQPHVNSGSVMLLHMMKKPPRNNSLMSVNRFYMPLKGKKKYNTCCVQWQSNTIHYLSQKTQNIMRNEMSYYKRSSLTKTFIFLIRVTQRLSVDFIRMVTVRSPERTSGSEAE